VLLCPVGTAVLVMLLGQLIRPGHHFFYTNKRENRWPSE